MAISYHDCCISGWKLSHWPKLTQLTPTKFCPVGIQRSPDDNEQFHKVQHQIARHWGILPFQQELVMTIFTNGKGLYIPFPAHINHKRNHVFFFGNKHTSLGRIGCYDRRMSFIPNQKSTATWFSAVPTARYAPWTKPNLSVALHMRCGGSLSLVPPDCQKNCWFNMGKLHNFVRWFSQ